MTECSPLNMLQKNGLTDCNQPLSCECVSARAILNTQQLWPPAQGVHKTVRTDTGKGAGWGENGQQEWEHDQRAVGGNATIGPCIQVRDPQKSL